MSVSPATDLPKELEGKTALTAKQRKKDVAYRDTMLLLRNTAARLTQEQQELIAASEREAVIRQRIERIRQTTQGRKQRGEPKRRTELALFVATDELAAALFVQGKYSEAVELLRTYASDQARLQNVKDKLAFYESVQIAIDHPDADHCNCPPEDLKTECRIYIPQRARFVDLVACLCGHRNATEVLPQQVVKARRKQQDAIAVYGDQTTDSHIQSLPDRDEN